MSSNNSNNISDNPNEDICKMLLELAESERNSNIYKCNAYKKAAKSLENYDKRVKTLSEAKKLPGIGDSIGKKIVEFVTTGSVQRLDTNKTNDKVNGEAIEELMRITGIGHSTALKFAEQGIDSIEKLKKNENLLTHHQKIGLKYLEEFEQKIPRKEIEKIEKYLIEICNKFDKRISVTICGSYRRLCNESSDIDVLISHKRIKSDEPFPKYGAVLKNLVDLLEKSGFITDHLSLGDTKFMGVCHLNSHSRHRRIDIRFLPIDQYYCGILYFTGSKLFNQQMRRHANENDFTLNEYSLRRLGVTSVPGEQIPIYSEEEIFEYINYPYKEPKDRNL